jgi:hypothetical protein
VDLQGGSGRPNKQHLKSREAIQASQVQEISWAESTFQMI